MKKIGGVIPEHYRNIVLKGFDPVGSAGFTQVPNYILRSKALSVGAKLTYAMLLSYAWHNNQCFPGQETLAQDIGISPRSVATHIKELQKAGWISVKRSGFNRPNLYTLHATVPKKRT